MFFLRPFFAIIRHLFQYLHYLIVSHQGKGNGLHSAFISRLYQEAIIRKQDDTVKGINNYIQYLKKSSTPIHCSHDYGAGSTYSRNTSRIAFHKLVNRSSVPPKYGKILYYLVSTFQPANILEMGTSVGISTIYLAAANEHSTIWSIESCPEKRQLAKENLQIWDLKNVYLYQGLFHEELPKILHHMPSLDMVFIDGDHRKESLLSYYETMLDYIHHDTMMVIDDIHWSSGMESAWKMIRTHKSVQVSIDLFRMGILFFSHQLSPEHMQIRY